VIGGANVPKGKYSLHARTSSSGDWRLIINRDTGAQYVLAQDLARVPLTGRTLPVAIESLTIALVPAGDGSPRGDLRIAWGTREYTTTWSVR
jgi:hypothetical protein